MDVMPFIDRERPRAFAPKKDVLEIRKGHNG